MLGVCTGSDRWTVTRCAMAAQSSALRSDNGTVSPANNLPQSAACLSAGQCLQGLSMSSLVCPRERNMAMRGGRPHPLHPLPPPPRTTPASLPSTPVQVFFMYFVHLWGFFDACILHIPSAMYKQFVSLSTHLEGEVTPDISYSNVNFFLGPPLGES